MFKKLPNTATGNALRRLQDDGTNLTKIIEIDFFVFLASSENLSELIHEVKKYFPNVILDVDYEAEEESLTLYCKIAMIPNYDDVVEVEVLLDNIAKKFGGWLDGFGSYGN